MFCNLILHIICALFRVLHLTELIETQTVKYLLEALHKEQQKQIWNHISKNLEMYVVYNNTAILFPLKKINEI